MKANLDNKDFVSGSVTDIHVTLEKLLIWLWQDLALPLACPVSGMCCRLLL